METKQTALVEIKSRWTGDVLYSMEVERGEEHPLRVVVAAAVKAGAYLARAYLAGANLVDANLVDANHLPSPAAILSGNWGEVPDDLCMELMRWDAANHPDPTAFDRWAASPGGPYPYDGVKVARATWFREKRELWSPGPSMRPYDLAMKMMEWAKGNYDKAKADGEVTK